MRSTPVYALAEGFGLVRYCGPVVTFHTKPLDDTPQVIACCAVLSILLSPGSANAYVDPTGGGFLLQLLLGGGTAFLVVARLVFKRFVDRIGRRIRPTK